MWKTQKHGMKNCYFVIFMRLTTPWQSHAVPRARVKGFGKVSSCLKRGQRSGPFMAPNPLVNSGELKIIK